MAKRILFQGDSITDAGRRRDEFFDLGRGYALMTAGALAADRPGLPVSLSGLVIMGFGLFLLFNTILRQEKLQF